MPSAKQTRNFKGVHVTMSPLNCAATQLCIITGTRTFSSEWDKTHVKFYTQVYTSIVHATNELGQLFRIYRTCHAVGARGTLRRMLPSLTYK